MPAKWDGKKRPMKNIFHLGCQIKKEGKKDRTKFYLTISLYVENPPTRPIVTSTATMQENHVKVSMPCPGTCTFIPQIPFDHH
jgi:hypothetical protein